MKATQIVTVNKFLPMYKGEEEANNIHIVKVEEHDFDVVAQKSLYKIGDKALFIQPDYCIPNTALFSSFIAPEGNPNKSRLGKNNRVRAIKFGFTDQKGNKVYSNGILLPMKEVLDFLSDKVTNEQDIYSLDFDELLGITKYEEPEGTLKGDVKGDLPLGMYKTDETNIKNLNRELENLFPNTLIGTVKVDGSSLTVYYKSDKEFGICSRGLEKKITSKKYEGFTPFYNKELNKKGWVSEYNSDLFIEDIDLYFQENNLEAKEVISQDDWVKLGYPILEKLKTYGRSLAVRAEIFGNGLKGSGNKNNPHANLPKSVAVYGIDDYSLGICKPLSMKEVIDICTELNLPMVKILFIKNFNSKDDLMTECNNIFNEQLIEGVVVRTFETNIFSAKLMNDEYDSKK